MSTRRSREKAVADQGGHELIIVRRHEEEEHEHHSSAWKVAHADFMTAMMAFFLIMWLINVTDDQVRKGISEYFNPIHMSQGSTDLKGLNNPDQQSAKQAKKGHGNTPLPDDALNLMKLTAGHADKKTVTEGATPPAPVAASEAAAAGNALPAQDAGAPAPAPSTADERAALQDPYAVLAKLANAYTADHPASVDVIAGAEGQIGVAGGTVDRDPFDPTYWQLSPAPAAVTDKAGKPESSAKVPAGAQPDAAAARSPDQTPTEPTTQAGTPDHTDQEAAQATSPAQSAANADAPSKTAENKAKPEARALSEAVAADIARTVEATMAGEALPKLSVAATAEGVTINLTDAADYSMFPIGSAVPDAKTVVLLENVAKVLATHPGEIVIRGFTDGRPFHSADYDNWRLSAARAHMAYYMLTRGGLEESRVKAIEGHADRSLKNPSDPYAAENRRIEILLKENG